MNSPRSSLYLLPSQPILGDEAAIRKIAVITDVPEVDIRQRCGRNRLSLLVRAGDGTPLETMRSSLTGMGHGAAILTDDEVRKLPFALAVRGVSIEGRALRFLDAEGNTLETLSDASDLLLIVTNLERPGDNPVSPLENRTTAKSPRRVHEEAEKTLDGLLSSHLDGIVVDVVTGGRRLRIRSRRFHFMTLGEQAGPSVAENMKTLIGEILSRAERPLIDLGFGGLRPPVVTGIGPQLSDGRPVDHPESEEERELESYSRCLMLLWKKGLFENQLQAGRLTGERFITTSIGVEGAADVAAKPEFWTPPAGPPTHRVGAFRSIGPAPIVIPLGLGLFLAGLALFNGQTVLGAGAGLLTGGLLCGVHGLALLSRRRHVENVPTSRIRSVAVGPCEIQGKARAIVPLRTPFSSMPCVYYEYRIVSNEAADSTVGLSWNIGSKPEVRGRSTIQTGSSGHIPFLVEDDTGSIEVDPAGAIVEVKSEQSLANVPFAGGMVPAGTRVTAWEKYIPEGFTVTVMGEMKQILADPAERKGELIERLRGLKKDPVRLAACDLDGNGVIDDAEWSRARETVETEVRHDALSTTGRLDRTLIGRPGAGGLFLISERSEKYVVRSLALKSRILMIAGPVLVAAGLFVLTQLPR